MRVRLHGEAETEIAEAADYYGAISPRLRTGFEIELTRVISLLNEQPWLGTPLPGHLRLRRLVVDRFPYSLIYLVRDRELLILAAAHHSRRPHYWRSRTD